MMLNFKNKKENEKFEIKPAYTIEVKPVEKELEKKKTGAEINIFTKLNKEYGKSKNIYFEPVSLDTIDQVKKVMENQGKSANLSRIVNLCVQFSKIEGLFKDLLEKENAFKDFGKVKTRKKGLTKKTVYMETSNLDLLINIRERAKLDQRDINLSTLTNLAIKFAKERGFLDEK